MADLNDEVNAVTANLSKLSAEFDRYSRLTSGAAESSKGLSAAQRIQEAATRSASDSLYSLKKASGSLGTSLYEGRRGMSAFTTATAATAEAVANAGAALAKAGGALASNKAFSTFLAGVAKIGAGGLKVAATLYDLTSNMADRQYDAYSKLSDTGAIASEGMTGVGTAAEKLGLNILKMDDYLSLVNENSKQLASFGSSVFDGRRKFENLGQALAGERENLFKLGMTQEQVNESMMGYIRLQNLAGKSQKISTEELTASTRKYLYEQDALAKLLGMSRKEQQSAREAALSEQRFGAKIAAMRASGDAQQIAAAEQLQQQNLVLAKVSPELAQGFRDLTTGMMTTEAAQKANMSTQGQVMKDIQDVRSGLKTGGAGAYSSLQALAETSEKFNMAYQMGTGENFLVKFAETQEARQFLERDFNTEMRKILDERGKLLDTVGKKPEELGDKRLMDYARLLKDQQQIMIGLQTLVNKGIPLLIDGKKIVPADIAVEIQRDITASIIDIFKNNPYLKVDIRNAGKSTTDQIVSTDTELKQAKLEEARAKAALKEQMEKVSLLEKAVKAGVASQAMLDAENKKLQQAADLAKEAETNRVNAQKKSEKANKIIKPADDAAKSVSESTTPEPAALKIDQVSALDNDQVSSESKITKLNVAKPKAAKVEEPDFTLKFKKLIEERDEQVKLNNNSIQKSIVTAAENQLASLNEVNGSQKELTNANKNLITSLTDQAKNIDTTTIQQLIIAAKQQIVSLNETTGSQKELTDANKNLISVLGDQVKNIDTTAIQKLTTAAEKQLVSMNETTANLTQLTDANKKLIAARDEQAKLNNAVATQKSIVAAAEKQLVSMNETTASLKDVTAANEKLIAARDEQAKLNNAVATQKSIVAAAEKQLAAINETTGSLKDVTAANEKSIAAFGKQSNIDNITAIQKLVVTAAEKQLASLTETTSSWKNVTNANENLITSFDKQANIKDIAAMQKLVVTAVQKQLASLTETTGSYKDITDANEKSIAARNKQENINYAAAIQKINEAKLVVIAAEKQLAALNETTVSQKELADANANLVTARNNQVAAEKQLEKTLKDRVTAEEQLTVDQKKVKPNNPPPVKITPAPETATVDTTKIETAKLEAAKTAADKSKAAESKTAQLPELKVGSKVSYEDLIQEQKDAINHLLASIGKLPVMNQSIGNDQGKVEWEKQLKNDVATQAQLFDAINNQVKFDREQKNKTNKNSNESVAPNDRRMNDVASLGADLSSVLGANIKNIPTMSDLMINSDVATLNSKGMNITLDNSADISRMLAETVIAKSDVEKKDQSTARNSFENSLSDVKSALTNQKDTNEMLLAAIQELVRVQKSGVSVNEKILAAQA